MLALHLRIELHVYNPKSKIGAAVLTNDFFFAEQRTLNAR